MILEIRRYPDSILRKECEPIEEITPEISKLIEDMFETMYKNQGVGLAAPQVGISKQLAVIDVGKGPMVLINPRVVRKKGKVFFEEGCLSIPGEYLKIRRAKEVEVEAFDEKMNKFSLKASGLLAICLQQEMDHLNGILMFERAGFLQRIKRKLFG
jgi:peptide deformylase